MNFKAFILDLSTSLPGAVQSPGPLTLTARPTLLPSTTAQERGSIAIAEAIAGANPAEEDADEAQSCPENGREKSSQLLRWTECHVAGRRGRSAFVAVHVHAHAHAHVVGWLVGCCCLLPLLGTDERVWSHRTLIRL